MDSDLSLEFFWGAFSKRALLDKYTSFHSLIDLLLEMRIDIQKDEIDSTGTTVYVEDISVLAFFKFNHLNEDYLNLVLDASISFKDDFISVSPELRLQKNKSFASCTIVISGVNYLIDAEQKLIEDIIKVDFKYSDKNLATLNLPIFINLK
jgi:hypothetical protein